MGCELYVIDPCCTGGFLAGLEVGKQSGLVIIQVTATSKNVVYKNVYVWIKGFKGKKILGLASGGGQQMPILTALGAKCTVMDFSKKQLENEKIVAERENYQIEIVHADMTKRIPFADESFDLIFHPVSNVYVEDVYHIWNECFRVLRKKVFCFQV